MKRIILLLVTAFVCVSCASPQKKSRDAAADFSVGFEQNGEIREIVNGEIFLEKKEFFIVVTFPLPDAVYVNASSDPETFDLLKSNAPVDKIPGFGATAMAEDLFNQDETLMLSKVSPGYWHYTGENDHRFSAVSVSKNGIVCKRKISFVADIDGKKNREPLSAWRHDLLYLCFMKLEWNKDFTERTELKRQWIKIYFRDKRTTREPGK